MLLLHLGMTYKIWCSTWLYRFNVKVQWEISKTRVKLLQSSVCEKLLNSSQFWLDYVQSEIKNGRLENKMCVSTSRPRILCVVLHVYRQEVKKNLFAAQTGMWTYICTPVITVCNNVSNYFVINIIIFMLDLFKRILRPRPNFRRP